MMTEYTADSDLEQPLLADEHEQVEQEEYQQQQQQQQRQEEEYDDDNGDAVEGEDTTLCSMAALSSVGLGFVTQMVVFLALDSSLGHPPSIVLTLPISVVISTAILFVMSVFPAQKFIKIMTSKTFLSGLTLGTCIQMVSLGSTAIMALKFGNSIDDEDEGDDKNNDVPEHDFIMYYILVVLSQSWWVLFPIICLAIDGGLTGNGRSCFGRVFFGTTNKSATASKTLDDDENGEEKDVNTSSADATRREIFLGGVRFHVGIVVGCFLVWSLIDVYFKASTGILLTLVVSFVACLALCYGMVYIHDRYIVSNTSTTQDLASKNTPVKKPVYVDGILVV